MRETFVKVLCEDRAKGEMTCLIKLEPGAPIPFHIHPELEQAYVLRGAICDHDGICRAGECMWRKDRSFHENHADNSAVLPAIDRKPNICHGSTGFRRNALHLESDARGLSSQRAIRRNRLAVDQVLDIQTIRPPCALRRDPGRSSRRRGSLAG